MAAKKRTCSKCGKPIDPQDFDAGMAGEVDTEGEGIAFVHLYDCTGEEEEGEAYLDSLGER